ncbi:MAG: hypothetical protein IPG50_30975 [Myxococcales bacterium]|nr:hypothetical protein [Myxococcales bacterium]
MSSRLFKAIVGAGIALGATSVACGRFADESNAEVGQPTSPAVGTPGPAATVSTSADGAAAALPEADANTDAEADAGVSEVDGSADVLVDAFCDNTWPTTKGHGGELPSICVDPTGACTPKGLPHHCYADLGGGAAAALSTCRRSASVPIGNANRAPCARRPASVLDPPPSSARRAPPEAGSCPMQARAPTQAPTRARPPTQPSRTRGEAHNPSAPRGAARV